MGISIVGLAVAAYLIYLFATNMSRADTLLIRLFTFNLLFEGFINVGYFINTSGVFLKVPDVLQLICAMISLIIFIKKGTKFGLIAFVFSIGMSVVMLVVNPLSQLVRTFDALDYVDNMKYMHFPQFDGQTVKTTLRLICFAVNGMAVAICMTKERWKVILRKYLKGGRYIILYAWLEFALKNILHVSVTDTIIQLIFGADREAVSELMRNGLSVVTGLNNEPSQFCMMLYSYYVVYLLSRGYVGQRKSEQLVTISGLALMVLCGSFRIVGFVPILLVIYLIVSKRSFRTILMTSAVSCIFLILYINGALDYYIERLGRALDFASTLDTSIGGGEAGRLNTIVEALDVFKHRLIFGIGPGQTFAYGFIPSMLSTTGLSGLVTWYNLMFNTIGNVWRVKNRKEWIWLLLIVGVSWIYTDSIAIGYSIYVLAIAFTIRYYEAPKNCLKAAM